MNAWSVLPLLFQKFYEVDSLSPFFSSGSSELSNIILCVFETFESFLSLFSTASTLVLPLLSLVWDHPAWNTVVLWTTHNGVCSFSSFFLLQISWLLALCKKSCIFKVLYLGFTPLYLCVCVCFGLGDYFDCHNLSFFPCILFFLSSHAFSVTFGIYQHLPHGENSPPVAVCV